jgi:hypothetical protein
MIPPNLPIRLQAIAETVSEWDAPITAREDLDAAAGVIRRLLHYRVCRDCGHGDYYKDNVVPACLCVECGSRDTRAVK